MFGQLLCDKKYDLGSLNISIIIPIAGYNDNHLVLKCDKTYTGRQHMNRIIVMLKHVLR